jgi:hypothetical protein
MPARSAWEKSQMSRQHLQPFLRPRQPLRQGDAEAAELVGRVAHAHAELHAATTYIVEHREVLGETHRVAERQQADVRREPHARCPRRHRAGHRRPRRQVAVLHEVVLGEPHEVEAEAVEPRDLVEDLRVEARCRDAGVGRIPEVVDDAQPEGKTGHARP